ncbi:MAG: DUF1501 domain-containing protein [Actinomycetota bacterium]
MNRRRFLTSLAVGAGGAAVGLTGCSGGGGEGESVLGSIAADMPEPTATPIVPETVETAGPSDDRVLVVIELEGGNDGLDTLVPYGDPRYVDNRANVGVEPEAALAIDDEVGLNPNLAAFHASGGAVLEGVGMADPDLSHFESARRWWTGDMTGSATFTTGFLGRLCDELARDEAVTGVSIGRGAAPTMRSGHAVTLSVPDPWAGGGLTATDWPFAIAAREGLATMAANPDGSPLELIAGANMNRALGFLDVLDDLPERDDEAYPGSQISFQLQTCARLLAGDTGVRVIHVPWGSFDTHDDHRGSHDYQLMELDQAVAAFRADLGSLGLAETTLIATTSEFGRRPAENAGGTDHGTASTMLLAGPVVAGRHGEAPSLRHLDDDGNLIATVGMDAYYATLAEGWFGVPTTAVLPGSPTPIAGVISPS